MRSPSNSLEEKKEYKLTGKLFPDDISKLIIDYMPASEIASWIPENTLDRNNLNQNPGSENYFRAHPEEIIWPIFSKNPASVEILKELPESKLDWEAINENPGAGELMERWVEIEPTRINWYLFSKTPQVVKYLDTHMEFVDKDRLSANPAAVPFLERHPEFIVWEELSRNPRGIHLLKQNPDLIEWEDGGICSNPAALDLLEEKAEEDPHVLNWAELSENPGAVPLLRKNVKKIRWAYLVKNPAAWNLISNLFHVQHLWQYPDFWKNPAAIPLIRELVEDGDRQINWDALAKNPGIFETNRTGYLEKLREL